MDEWGVHRRYIEHGSGGYWDCAEFPLAAATEEEVARWPMPTPDDYDYSQIVQQCRQAGGFALSVGGPGAPISSTATAPCEVWSRRW